jgi:hypothetical protein
MIHAMLKWNNIINSKTEDIIEYFHRRYDVVNRIVVDKKYNSMKEIVENVYYNVSDHCEHYLVKKINNVEQHIIKLKSRGWEN